jgi:hypothetical protein
MKKILNILLIWLPFAILATILSGLVFGINHQNMRSIANDPQIQFTEDASNILKDGVNPQSIVNVTNPIDLSKSIGTFVIVFDEDMKVLASSGKLNNETPAPPKGSFEFAKQNGQNRFTWAPQKNVRIAAVMTHFSGQQSGYILAGRSLREVENRSKNMLVITVGALAIALITTLGSVILYSIFTSKKPVPAE